jgi:hypothetical protein
METVAGLIRSVKARSRTDGSLVPTGNRPERMIEAHGASVSIIYQRGYPVVINSEEETTFATDVVKELVGEEKVGVCPMIPGSEDFAYFLEHKPSCFLRLGNGENSAILHKCKIRFQRRQRDHRCGHVGSTGGKVIRCEGAVAAIAYAQPYQRERERERERERVDRAVASSFGARREMWRTPSQIFGGGELELGVQHVFDKDR